MDMAKATWVKKAYSFTTSTAHSTKLQSKASFPLQNKPTPTHNMEQYDNTNRGSLFKNDKKEQDSHADYNGSINVEGKEFWLNAWVKESKKDGRKFFGLSLKPKGDSGNNGLFKAKPAQSKAKQDDDEIPF